MKKDTHFAVTVPFKLLDFKEQYNGVCRATSNFGNTGGERINILKNLFYYHLQLDKNHKQNCSKGVYNWYYLKLDSLRSK